MEPLAVPHPLRSRQSTCEIMSACYDVLNRGTRAMRLIGKSSLQKLPVNNDDVNRWINIWCAEMSHAHWKDPADVTKQFPRAIKKDSSSFAFPIGDYGQFITVSFLFPQGVAVIVEPN